MLPRLKPKCSLYLLLLSAIGFLLLAGCSESDLTNPNAFLASAGKNLDTWCAESANASLETCVKWLKK